MTTRVPPQSLEAEQATLGSMLIERSAIGQACELLQAEDFYREAHRKVFEASRDLCDRGEPVDLTTLAAELENRGQLEQAGGRPYLAALLDAVPTAAHVEHYARIVAEKGRLRRMITVCTEIVSECFGDVEKVEELIERAEAAVLGVRGDVCAGDFLSLREMLKAATDRADERGADTEHGMLVGIPSGLQELDDLTQGFRNGNLIYVGGRPGMGKTTLMDTIALHAARSGHTVAQFSFEESAEEKAERYIAQGCGLNSVRVRTGRLSDEQWRRMAEGVNRMRDYPLWTWNGSALTPGQLASKARRFKSKHGLGLVTVDYIQLMHIGRKTGGRTEEVDEISRALKRMASELDVPVIVGSQLSRKVEDRKVPRPMLADMRESGSIEADANLVVLLYNPEYYRRMAADATTDGASEDGREPDPDSGSEWRDEVEVIVAKHRGGPTGTARAAFHRNTVEFRNLNDAWM